LLEKELRFKERFVIESVAFFTYSLVTIIFVYWGIGIWSIVYGKISQSLIQTSLLWIVAGWRPHSFGDFKVASEMLNYGRYITTTSILALSFQYVDNIAIGRFSGTEALGSYVLAYSLANFPAKFTSVLINRISFPIYSQLQQNKDKLSKVFFRVIQIVTLFSIPASIGILILASRLILTLYTDKWAESINVLQILSFYGLARSVGSLSNNVLFVLGKKELIVKINLFVISSSIVLLYPVTINFGIIGVGFLVTLIIVISSVGLIHLSLKYLEKSWYALLSFVKVQIFGTLFMALIILPLTNFLPFTLFYLILLGVIGSSVYAGSILFLTRGRIISEGFELIEEIGFRHSFLDFLLKQFAPISRSFHKKRG
jgi:O-antigen/teichoic acid export membrane protein